MSEATERAAWLAERERGSMFAIRALLAAHRWFGREFARVILRIVALYYAMFATRARQASQDYFRRLGERPSFWRTVAHVRTFAECAFDRVLFVAGQIDDFTITRNGKHHLAELARSRRGALLLGAHLGSFEAMRAMSNVERLPLNVLVHFANARKITAMLKAIAPDFDGRVIEIDPASPHFVLTVAERIEAGELVAVLGDRVGLGESEARARFLGEDARFPVGPYALAAALRCPIYLTFGLYHAPRHYSLYCEPFVDRVLLPRAGRDAALAALAQRYADRLELFTRRAPLCWFNFFDFWA